MNAKLQKSIFGEYRIEGLGGVYKTHMIRTFNHIYFYPIHGRREFVGSVSGGNYGKNACGNPNAGEMIEEKILDHAKGLQQ